MINTNWASAGIWMRRTFELAEVPKDRKLLLWLSHDEDVKVFINGVVAGQASGYTTSFKGLVLSPAAVDALKAGHNTIAVHCRHGAGGQFIDVALVAADTTDAPSESNEPTPKLAFSLLGEQNPEEASGRAWSDSYLAFTQPRPLSGFLSGRPNSLVRWISAQSAPPMLPPYGNVRGR